MTTQSIKLSAITFNFKLDWNFLNTATPPRGFIDFKGFERPTIKNPSGHFVRILKWVSDKITISLLLSKLLTSFNANLSFTPLMFQQSNLKLIL